MTNVSIDVIRDLLPAYYSGEASEDTRRLVEAFLEANPSFAEEAHAWSAETSALAPAPDAESCAEGEARALRRTKGILRWQQLWLTLAATCTLNVITLGFSFSIEAGKVHVQWMTLPGQAVVVALLAVAAGVFWLVYASNGRRIRRRILG